MKLEREGVAEVGLFSEASMSGLHTGSDQLLSLDGCFSVLLRTQASPERREHKSGQSHQVQAALPGSTGMTIDGWSHDVIAGDGCCLFHPCAAHRWV